LPESLLIRDVPPKIKRWIDDEREQSMLSQREYVISVLEKAYNSKARPSLFDAAQHPAPTSPTGTPFTFVDLFAGIGGLRLALERVGGRSVFSCEWDKNAQKTYRAWYGEVPEGDIRKVKIADILDHDILAAGFPCQPFSIAGVSKKKSLGRPHGFKDATQGTLFFHLATIIDAKRPPVLLLENVKNLRSHEKGRTWEVVRSTLETMNYKVFAEVIDAAHWVPQHRERVFIVGFDKSVFGNEPPFRFPTPPTGKRPKLMDILDPNPPERYTLTDHLWKYLQKYAKMHRLKGNGFGYGLADLDGVTRTLSARYYKDGSEILIPQEGKNPRRLTPREAQRLMGFPDHLSVVVSDTQAYRQFGNAVVPLVAEAVAKQISAVLSWQLARAKNRCVFKGRFGKAR
jgi:DNA (cytosine-5)-methyltransferase 1